MIDILLVALNHSLVAVTQHTLHSIFAALATHLQTIEVSIWRWLLETVNPDSTRIIITTN